MTLRLPRMASPCPRGSTSARIAWTAVILLILVTPFAGFIAPTPVSANHTNIKMPFASGATWRVLQGYNGSSHQNTSSTWQYYYSLDLVRADGTTAGQRVISPVNGTIRWIDESTGGMSINLGDGYAFAYFHTRIASGLAAGDAIVQGQYLGTVAPSGEASNGGTPHIHVTLWSTTDGGNWDRRAVPFTGEGKIDGYDFPDKGGSNQYLNTQVVSTNSELQTGGSGASAPDMPTLTSPATGTTYRTAPTTATLRWSSVSGATEYQVVINDGSITSPWVSGTSWTTGSLGNGQYTWQVRARNSSGASGLTAKWVFWIDASTTATTTPTKTATPSGTKTPTGTATPAPLKTTLNTTSGRVGTSVTASGTGFGANETIRLYIDSVTSANQLVQTTANASGAWSTTLTIPDAIGGSHSIIGRGMTTDLRSPATFTVTSYLNRTPYQGPVGTTINLTVQGFGASETVKVNFDSTSGTLLTNVTTNAKGTGTATFTLPEGVTGWHDYVGVGQTSKLSAWGALYVEQKLKLSATTGAPGANINVTANGFAGSQAITIAWNRVAGSNGTSVCSGTTSAKGSYSCSFAIPQAVAGSYPVVAATNAGSSTVNVTVTGSAAVSVSPSSGPVGGNLSVSLGGFNANETVNFTWDSSTTVWQSRTADASGSLNFPALVPNLSKAAHTLRAKGVTSGKTASTSFTITSGTPTNTSMIGPGTFAVTATEEDLIGETTSNGHKIVPLDRFVALPACTESSCPWATPGGDRYVAQCGDNCFVRVTNPVTNQCSVAPVWDVGPWFTNDNWWDPTNQRVLNNLPTTKNVLPQGYTGADAAKDGLDVGYGISNGVGISNVGYQVGNRAVIDLGDGTWTDIGFADGQGIGQVVVTILWLSGEDHDAAARACGTPNGPGPLTPTPSPTPTTTPTANRSVRLSPSNALVGDTVKVTGTGYAANEKVDVYLDSMSSTALGTFTTNSSGAFSGSVVIPAAKAGSHKIYGRGRTVVKSDSAPLTVLPMIYRPSGTANAGSSIKITVKGYGASESVQVRWNSATASVLGTVRTDSKGSGSGSVTIPGNVATGSYLIFGTGATTGVQSSKSISVSNPTVVDVTPTPDTKRSVRLSPSSAPVGNSITVSGTGYAANESVDIYLDSMSSVPLATFTSNGSGGFSGTIVVPATKAGSHKIYGRGRTVSKSDSAALTVLPAVFRPSGTSTAGSSVKITVKGFGASESVQIRWNSANASVLSTFKTDASGTASGSIKIPSDSQAGTYSIFASGVTTGLQASKTIPVANATATTVTLSTSQGSPRSTVTATGANFSNGEVVEFFWDSSSASVGSGTANSSGGVTIGADVPLMPFGTHTVKLKGQTSGKSASANYTIVPMLEVSPTSGAGGVTVTVKGRGWAASTSAKIYWNRTGTSSGTIVCTVTSSSTGTFSCTFTAPSAASGAYPVVGIAGSLSASTTFRISGAQIASLSEQVVTAEEASPTPTPTPTVEPSTEATATATPEPTQTATENATPEPTATETPIETATPKTTATETPAETPTVEPTLTATPEPTVEPTETPARDRRVTLSPRRGEAGTEVAVSGSGFDAGESVDIFFDTTNSAPVVTVQADEDGTFAATIVVPDIEAGDLLIAAKGQTSGVKASRSFRVTAPRASRDEADGATEVPTDEDAQSDTEEVTEEPAAPTEEAAAEPTVEPTVAPEPREIVLVPVADTSVAPIADGTPEAQSDVSGLVAGGESGAVTFITFQVEGVAAGSVISAQLVLTATGDASGSTGTIGALPGVWTDEGTWTYDSAPIYDAGAAIAADGSAATGWLDPWVETVIDVTGTVSADGTITFVIPGTPDATIVLGSRESGAPARLIVTAIDNAT